MARCSTVAVDSSGGRRIGEGAVREESGVSAGFGNCEVEAIKSTILDLIN